MGRLAPVVTDVLHREPSAQEEQALHWTFLWVAGSILLSQIPGGPPWTFTHTVWSQLLTNVNWCESARTGPVHSKRKKIRMQPQIFMRIVLISFSLHKKEPK
jgi:hypothetical protein